MRILIVSQYFYPEEFRINDVAWSLQKKGHVVDVLTGKPNYPVGTIFDGYRALGRTTENYNGVTIHRVPMIPRGRGGLRLSLNYLSFVVSGVMYSRRMLRNREYDVVFVYGNSPILQAIPAIFIRWCRRIPVVLWVQDLWPESLQATGYIHSRAVLGAVRSIVGFIYRHVDLLLAQSQTFVRALRPLAATTVVKYYPNSVDDSFAVRSAVEKTDIHDGSEVFSVVFAGNIGSAQAVEVIINAANQLKEFANIQFVVVGDGSRRNWMMDQVERLQLSNVSLPGRSPVDAMPKILQSASVLLVTLSDHKIFSQTVPNKVQAYMASRRPIIACLNGEGARLVASEAKCGIAVQSEDSSALADAVLAMYRSTPQERDAMGARGFEYYNEHFKHDKLVDELVEHFELLVNNRWETQ